MAMSYGQDSGGHYWIDINGQKHYVAGAAEARNAYMSNKGEEDKRWWEANPNAILNGKTNPYATGGATPPAPGGALERSLGYYKGLDVTPEMEQEMLNKYQGSLTAKLQAAAGNLANPMSGQSNKDVMDMYGTGAAVSSRLPIEVRMDMAKFNKELADSRASVEKGFYTPPKTNYPAGFDTNAMNQLANLQMQNSIANEVSNPTPTVPLVSGGSLSAITNKMTGKNISDMKKRLRGY